MRSFLLEIAMRKADVVRKRLSEASLEAVKSYVESLWVTRSPRDIEPDSYGGVDGGNNAVEFKGMTLYAVLGYALARRPGGVEEHMVGDVDILYPPGGEERIRVLREIAETRAALRVGDVYFLLIDGSLRSLLIRPRPLTRDATLNEAVAEAMGLLGDDVFHRLYDGLMASVNNGESIEPFVFKKMVYEKGVTNSRYEHVSALLAYIEKLLAIRMLIESRIAVFGSLWPGIAYVSKTSRSQLYFDKLSHPNNIPLPSDMVLFSLFTHTAGYSKPLLQSELRDLKGLPGEAGLKKLVKDFYDSLDIIITYVRLEDYAPLFRVEIPVPRNIYDENTAASLVEKVMDHMKPLSYNGYPHILVEADKNAKITRGDMAIIVSALGLLPRLTGREVLGEWRWLS